MKLVKQSLICASCPDLGALESSDAATRVQHITNAFPGLAHLQSEPDHYVTSTLLVYLQTVLVCQKASSSHVAGPCRIAYSSLNHEGYKSVDDIGWEHMLLLESAVSQS